MGKQKWGIEIYTSIGLGDDQIGKCGCEEGEEEEEAQAPTISHRHVICWTHISEKRKKTNDS